MAVTYSFNVIQIIAVSIHWKVLIDSSTCNIQFYMRVSAYCSICALFMSFCVCDIKSQFSQKHITCVKPLVKRVRYEDLTSLGPHSRKRYHHKITCQMWHNHKISQKNKEKKELGGGGGRLVGQNLNKRRMVNIGGGSLHKIGVLGTFC